MAAITTGVIAAGTALHSASEQRKGRKALERSSPAGFTAPGLTGTFDKALNRFNVTRTAQGQRSLDALRGGFDNLASGIRGLRPQVRPGFGRLTDARVEAIRGAGSRAVGNLREELSKRRVLGSSFASREIASTEAEFGRLEEEARAESFLQELDMTRELITQEFQASISGAAAVMDQFNFESQIAANLGANASQQQAQTNAALAGMHAASAESSAALSAAIVGAFGDTWIPAGDPSTPEETET